jgi:hypothetical protein
LNKSLGANHSLTIVPADEGLEFIIFNFTQTIFLHVHNVNKLGRTSNLQVGTIGTSARCEGKEMIGLQGRQSHMLNNSRICLFRFGRAVVLGWQSEFDDAYLC